jgi:hypothetical protein
MDHPLLTQAAALLTSVVRQQLALPCSLEQLESTLHPLAHALARQAAAQLAAECVAQAEAQARACPCGGQPQAQQHRPRRLLSLFGLLTLRLRRYRCPTCGAWSCPGEAALQLRSRQRLTRTVEEWLGRFGLAWSYAVAAREVEHLLPGVAVSAKTVERSVARCGAAVAAREAAAAAAAAADERAVAGTGPALANPRRRWVALDGVMVRARGADQWLEIQVASLWSAWRELPDRQHPRRELIDVTVVARAEGWEALGLQVWRMIVGRGGLTPAGAEWIVFGDGAKGIRSLWEQFLPEGRLVLDRWHLWEKLKERSRQVFGRGPQARAACKEAYAALQQGAVERAQALVAAWPARGEWAEKQRQRLWDYLERHADLIPDYTALAAAGCLVGSGRSEKANDLVVVPRMKNGKMHWGRAGANLVALLRAYHLNDPDAPFLPI